MSDQAHSVYYFSDPPPKGITRLDTLLGGKGESLKRMTLAGLGVPPGFTISAECCEQYFELGRQWPAGLEEELRRNLRRLEEETQCPFGQGRRPLLLSVRSGAAASMPGMMDTILNCGLNPSLAEAFGDTPEFWDQYVRFILSYAASADALTEDRFRLPENPRRSQANRALAEAQLRAYEQHTGKKFPVDPWDLLVRSINAVFDSWLSDRAVAYRRQHDLGHLKGTAVNVQAMFPSEVSGILFTQDPTNPSANCMVIEAARGLGDAVVSGAVTPSRFTLRRNDLLTAEIESRPGEQIGQRSTGGVLEPDQVIELGKLGLEVEQHFGQPLDIEWAWGDGRFALLQARSIRGLDVAQEVEVGRREEILRLAALAGGRRRIWVAHNLAETLRFPTPLTWDVVRRFMSGSGGFGRLYRQLGYRPSQRVCEEGFLELICGRIYADPDRLAQLFWDRMPLTYDLDALAADRDLLDHAPTRFDPDRADSRFLARLPGNLLAMWRVSRNMKRLRRDARRAFEEQVLPPYLQYVERARTMRLSELSDEQVLSELHERSRRVLDEFGPESLKPGFFGGLALDALRAMLVQLMGKENGTALAATLTSALEGDSTFEQDALLHKVARGKAALEEFLERFGHRCVGEMELAEPRWRERPEYVESIVARLYACRSRDPEQIRRESTERRAAAESELPETLDRWGGSSFREELEGHLREARGLLPYRETGKHYLMMGYEVIRLATEELAGRWGLKSDIYFLRWEELEEFPHDRGRLTDIIARRRVRWKAMRKLDAPDTIDSEYLEELGLVQKLEALDRLDGTPVASGVATGTARVVFDPQHAVDLGADTILVCPSTDPGWTPLFFTSCGLVVERGGMLSHGAIVARDFGIPAVVCPNATRHLRSGDRVRVDGNSGRVLVITKVDSHA